MLAAAVEQWSPGVWQYFFNAVNGALSPMPERITLTSWWRSAAQNVSVGGVDDSQHLAGLAADLVFPTLTSRRTGIARLQAAGLGVLDEGDHVHVQVFQADVARQLLAQLRAWRVL
jgi:uncharacterized protein YcbK (DUF882 family)